MITYRKRFCRFCKKETNHKVVVGETAFAAEDLPSDDRARIRVFICFEHQNDILFVAAPWPFPLEGK